MLPQMVTETADFRWNAKTQHFESRIFFTDPESGKRELIAVYATPPGIFLDAFASQAQAIADFELPRTGAEVIDIKQHG